MLKEGHIEIYDLKLETKTPVFIGSGKKYYKTDYAYKKPEKLYIMDLEKLFKFLIDRNLIDEYEESMKNPKKIDLYKFLNKYGIPIKDVYSYSLDASEFGEPTNILEFIKDGKGNPYVPGSSIKGALRTVILLELIERKRKNGIKSTYRNGKKIKEYLSEIANKAEVKYLNLLGVNNDKKNAINSVMRGISISDSKPFDLKKDNPLILQKKLDIPANANGECKHINVTRESLKRGRTIEAKLCLDMSILNRTNIDIKPNKTFIEFIEAAIDNFAGYYKTYYLSKFKDAIDAINNNEPLNISYNDTEEYWSKSIIIGGGSGFFAKNIIYKMIGKYEGLNLIKEYMNYKFRNHKHDEDNIISPRCLKYAEYSKNSEKERQHFGICKVTITPSKVEMI